jgi:hypothetical protein
MLRTMNQALTIILVLVIGFLGGLLGSSFSGGSNSDSQYDMSIEGAAVADTQQLRDEISALEASNGSLRQQFEMQASSIAMLDERISNLSEWEATTESDALAFADMPTGQAFEGQVNAVIEQREAALALERTEQRAERQAAALESRVERLAEELGLDAQQTEQFGEIIGETGEKRTAMFLEMRESGDFDRETMRSEMTTMREDEYSQLEGVLTPEQLTQYKDSNSSGFGGGTRGGSGNQSTRSGDF